MSYGANYGPYSPYYQQPGLGQEAPRAGNTYQATSYQPNSYQANSYQSSSAQPLSTYQSQAATSTASPHDNDRHANANSARSQPTYQARTGYSDGRSSVDATNLGNLAYASSLGRAAPSSYQSNGYGGSNEFGLDAATSTSRRPHQVDNRGATGSAEADVNKSAPTTNSLNIGYLPASSQNIRYTSRNYDTYGSGRNSPLQPHNATSRSIPQPDRRYEQNYSALQQRLPAQTPVVRPTQPGAAPRARESPRLASSHESPFHDDNQRSEEGQNLPPSQQHHPSGPASFSLSGSDASARPRQPQIGQGKAEQTSAAYRPLHRSSAPGVDSVKSVVRGSGGNRGSSVAQTHIEKQRSQQTTPVHEQHPTTVDPSQIFNDYEYQKRKDEEHAKKKAAEVAQRAQDASFKDPSLPGAGRSGDVRSQSVSSQPSDILQAARAAIGSPAEADKATKDQMELEMKQMIEKMRDYKAKDPGLFSQIWEQVKKKEAPQAGSTTVHVRTASPSIPLAAGQPGSPTQSDLLAESGSRAASPFPPGFDRGRFPWQRRRRGGMQSPDVSGKRSHHEKPEKEAHSSQPPHALPPTMSAPVANMTSIGPSDETGQKSIAAMQTFHKGPITSPSAPTAPRQSSKPPPHTEYRSTDQQPARPPNVPAQKANVKPPTGRTLWPEHKKRALAEAAMKHLTATHPYLGQNITAAEIHNLLDLNPSYAQMCGYLERRGFAIDRGSFARLLLNAVPDTALSAQQSLEQTSAPLLAANAGLQALHHAYSSPYGQPQPQSKGQRQTDPAFQKPSINHSGSIPQRVHISSKVVDGQKPIDQPITKEDKARKRTFGDIVDLTQAGSDDEDFVRHRPTPKIVAPPDSRPLDPAGTAGYGNSNSAPTIDQVKMQIAPSFPPVERDPIFKERVVQPMNRRRDARRCSSYDPKTIARDILISSGKHPTMAPLNYHLEILRERFDHVNNDSDLSTFAWDIVDPRDKPPEEQVEPMTLADIMHQDDKGDAGRDPATDWPAARPENGIIIIPPVRLEGYATPEVSALHRTNNGRPRSHPTRVPPKVDDTAQKKNIQTARQQGQSQADMRFVNEQKRSALINSFAFNGDASRTPVGADAVPSPMRPPSISPFARCLRCRAQFKVCNGHRPCSCCRQAGIGASECIYVQNEPENSPPLSTEARSVKSKSFKIKGSPHSQILPPLPKTPSPKKELIPARTGRPPGAKNKQPRSDKGISKKGRPPGAKNRQPRSDKGIPKGSKSTSPLIAQSIRPSLRVESTSRRSISLRNAISPAAGIAVVIQSRSPSVVGSASQLDRKINGQAQDSTRAHESYRCGWERCPAELHNLDTLRKHVRKHRKGVDLPIPCRWAECGNIVQGATAKSQLTYENEKAWDRHLEKKHVRAVAKAHGHVLEGDSDEDPSDASVDDELFL